MAGGAKLESELDRDPDAGADPLAEAEDEDLAAHLRDLENGVGHTEIWSHLFEPRGE